MADIEKFMTVSAGDIEKIMGVAVGDIEAIMGFGVVTGPAWTGTRAVIFGARTTVSSAAVSLNDMLYKTLASDSNTSDFGDMVTDRSDAKGSGSNGTRLVQGGGTELNSGTATYGVDDIDYITAASTGAGTDFGNLFNSCAGGGVNGASNATLCFFNGGNDGAQNDDIEYITIASTGNGTDAGNLDAAGNLHETSNGDSKYLIIGGYIGNTPPEKSVHYNAFSTSANAADFSDGVYNTYAAGSVCAVDRVIVGGGTTGTTSAWGYEDEMQYFPVASAADGLDFGDLVENNKHIGGTSDGTRGEFYGGQNPSGEVFLNRIQKVTIGTLGNASDIGDLTFTGVTATSGTEAGGGKEASAQSGT